jgi:hypothetical protein
MAETVLDRIQGDSLPSYDGELVATDITGYTINLNIRKPDGSVIVVAATFIDAPNGIFTFIFSTSTFDLAGDYDAEIEVIDLSADKETFGDIVIQVAAEIA